MANNMFQVVAAADLSPERDVLVGLPVEKPGSKQSFHRVPIRSARTESTGGERRTRVQLVDGHPNVVQACGGLPRLLLRFPDAFVPGIRVFEANNENDRTNLSMGFALYDHRAGPTAEEQRVLANIDAFASFLRHLLIRCDRIRRTLKLGPDNMSAQQQQVAADMMDLHVARPAVDRGNDGPRGGGGGGGAPATMPSRYCYVKLVPPDPNVNEVYHTYFWTPDGKRIPFETVVGWRNFHAQPFVEVEDVFVSKAVRSLQLKLRECLVVPPVERMQSRFSVCFPERVCVRESEGEAVAAPAAEPAAAPVAAPAAEPAAAKRPADACDEETAPPAKRPCPAATAAAESEDDDEDEDEDEA